jgi:hypothetical protein
MSTATLPLYPKAASILFDVEPVSGLTLTTGSRTTQENVVSENVGLFANTTWTRSLLAKWPFAREHDPVGTGSMTIPMASSSSAAVALTSVDFGFTLDRLRSLRSDDDEQDRPSDQAYHRTVGLLRETARRIGMQFPGAIAATGPGRSVRLLWSSNEKELRLVIGGSAVNRSYIYWRHGARSGVDDTVEAIRFARYLNWIIEGV